MLTFRSFTTPLELLSLLKRRYYSEPPAEASSDEIEQFNNGELKNIRLRSGNSSFFILIPSFSSSSSSSSVFYLLSECQLSCDIGSKNASSTFRMSSSSAKRSLNFSSMISLSP